MDQIRQKMIAANRDEYGDRYHDMRFLSAASAVEAEDVRQQLLDELAGRIATSCQGTKLNTGNLSPGCALCREGVWSCLFINNLCNGTCFYCPTEQKKKAEPMTNSLAFPNPKEYTAYIGRFGFRGASISGGEPLLTLDRTLTYIRSVRKKFGEQIHLWMYTNGILFTEDKGKMLREAGLDEIRFDISAREYLLDRAELAAKIIPTVTVEIPAVPEDYERLRELLPAMAAAGIKHLNLHQMRATPHNLGQLIGRGYTFIHGPLVTVLESELTALRLLRDTMDSGQAPAVNYCSFAYKNRFQGRAARLRAAAELVQAYEDITPAGYIRSLAVRGDSADLDRIEAELVALPQERRFKRDGADRLLVAGDLLGSLFSVPLSQERFMLRGSGQGGDENSLRCFEAGGLTLTGRYFLARLKNNVSYAGSSKKIALDQKRTIFAERRPVAEIKSMTDNLAGAFAGAFLALREEGLAPLGLPDELVEIAGYEQLESGLVQYF